MAREKTLLTKLPKSLHRYFWDVDASEVDPSDFNLYIINRLLDRGNLRGIGWVLRNFSRDLICRAIKERRDWQKKSVNFWRHYFYLKKEEVKCLKKSFLNKRKTFWAY